jgi:hypothetical protein
MLPSFGISLSSMMVEDDMPKQISPLLLHAAAVGINRAVQQGLLPWCPAALESVRKGVEFFDSILKKLVE